MGADYSWSRRVARLVENRPLKRPANNSRLVKAATVGRGRRTLKARIISAGRCAESDFSTGRVFSAPPLVSWHSCSGAAPTERARQEGNMGMPAASDTRSETNEDV
jgi:hypothetical protein